MSKPILLLLLFFSTIASGQVVEKMMNMSAGEKSGLEVDLPVDSKDAQKLWKEYVKSYGKTDWDRRNKENVLFDVNISSISSSSITVVARFDQFQKMTKGSFWIKSGDEYVSSDGDVSVLRKAGEFLQEFAYETERYSIREMLKDQDKQLGNLEKDLSKLEKKNQNLHKDIQKAKEEILKKEREIEENLVMQGDKKKEIEKQRETISQTTKKLSNVGKS